MCLPHCQEGTHSRSCSGDNDKDILAGPRCHLHFDRKKIDFSVCFPLLLRIDASPINPSHICFTTSDPRLSRLDRMRNILGPAAREPAPIVGCVYMWIRPWILGKEAAVWGLLCEDGVQAGPGAGSICQRIRRIMQASIMNDLVPGIRLPEDFCGFPTTLCRCFHTPLDLLLLSVSRRGVFTASAAKMLAAIPK